MFIVHVELKIKRKSWYTCSSFWIFCVCFAMVRFSDVQEFIIRFIYLIQVLFIYQVARHKKMTYCPLLLATLVLQFGHSSFDSFDRSGTIFLVFSKKFLLASLP